MKYTFTLVLFLVTLSAYGQNDSTEKAILLKKLNDKVISEAEFYKFYQKWNQVLKQTGAYPTLPLDQNGEVHYTFIRSFEGIDDKLFNRTNEWLAIYYGLRPGDIYSNKEDGKIIFQNSINISNTKSCNYTSVITISGSKIRVENVNLGFQTYYPGYFSGETWVPEQTSNNHISQLYPVVDKASSEWQNTLNLFKTTNQIFSTDVAKLWIYIENYQLINQF